MKDFLAAIKKGEKAGYDSRSAEYNLARTFKIECMDGAKNAGSFMVDGEVYQGDSVKGSIADVKVWQVA